MITKHTMKRFLGTLALAFILSSNVASAADLSVSPLFLDLDSEARDIITKDITVTNNTGSKQIVYATVNEVAVDEGGKIMEFVSPAMSDRTDT
ncbi:MAG: hypothetical protein RL538_208, partial [Candidatus Parcubacteria bacterium]